MDFPYKFPLLESLKKGTTEKESSKQSVWMATGILQKRVINMARGIIKTDRKNKLYR